MDDPAGNKMLLVMDYMEGGPVLTREGLERGRRIPEPLSLQYFRDMCKVNLPLQLSHIKDTPLKLFLCRSTCSKRGFLCNTVISDTALCMSDMPLHDL